MNALCFTSGFGSGSGSTSAGVVIASTVTEIVDSATASDSCACCCSSDSRSASRRVSSDSMEITSSIVSAFAMSARSRSTEACCEAMRLLTSTSCPVTSWVDSAMSEILPMPPSRSITDS